MASIGQRGRGRMKGVRPKTPSAPKVDSATAGPGWKPAKASVTGNYGKAVSAAAHTRNAARKAASPAPVGINPKPSKAPSSALPKAPKAPEGGVPEGKGKGRYGKGSVARKSGSR